MRLQGVARFTYFTCPICGYAMSTSTNSVIGHLIQHVKKGTIPKNCVGYIGILLQNKKGCNARIAKLDGDIRTYVLDFVSKIRDTSYTRVDPVGDRARTHIK